MVHELQQLLSLHAPSAQVLAASFKTPRQALECLLAGCQAITLPVDVAEQFLNAPAVQAAVENSNRIGRGVRQQFAGVIAACLVYDPPPDRQLILRDGA